MSSLAIDVRNSHGSEDDKVIPHWKLLLTKARKALAQGKEIECSPGCVRPMPGQPRQHFDLDGLKRLAESMLEVGQIYSGIVRRVYDGAPPVMYELLDGERRLRAADMVKIVYRARLIDCDDETARFIIAAVANFNRASHTPLEVSDSIERMRSINMPMEEIASLLGISLYWAYEMHGLQKLSPKVRAMMDPG
ncbi:ParB N-terminal domain-containing protein [Candidatus Parcubacteria bacterium]|nr:ParB N-terminal domain-containing protein [Candidatus Parcubacteria bacterium]